MSQPAKSDAFFVEQVMEGKSDAFSVLAERYLPVVRAVALAQTRNPDDADDVAQEALLKAYTSLGKLRDKNRFGAWSATIARNLAVSLLRRQHRDTAFTRSERPDSVLEPDVVQRELYARVRGYIDELPPILRETVLLHYFAGLKLCEIAMVNGISRNAAEKRLSRARAALGDRILDELMQEEETGDRRGQVHKLMGLVAAAPPPWIALGAGSIGTPSALTLLGGLVVTKKIMLGAVLCVALAMALWGGLNAGKEQEVERNDLTSIASQPQDAVPLGNDATESPLPEAADSLGSDQTASTESRQGNAGLADEPVAKSTPTTPVGEIHGYVVDAETDEGIAGVVVWAQRDGSGKEGRFDGEPSDDTGAFVIENLEAGAYSVRRRDAEGYRSDGMKPDVQRATVNADEALEGLVFKLTKGVTVSGTLVDGAGAGVANAGILIGGGTQTFFNRRTKTALDGSYVFTGLTPTGDTWLHATSEGLAHRMEGPVVIPDEGIEGLTLTMTREAVVAGVLVDGKGVPIPRYTVSLDPDFSARMGGNKDITDDEGNFRIAAVFEGLFDIIVNPTDKGYMHPNRRTVDSIAVRAGARIGGLRVTYDVAMDLTISGRVTDTFGEPVAGQRVGNAPSEGRSVSMGVPTDDDGYYQIEGLSEGEYGIDITTRRNNFYHTFVRLDRVAAGTENLDFVITRFTTVQGHVVQPDGQTPVSDFEITRASDGANGWATAMSQSRFNQEFHEAEGRFELDMIGPGLLSIVVRAEGYQGALETVEVTEGEAIEDLVIQLEPGGALIGRVVGESGEAIPDALIYLNTLRYYDRSPVQPIARTESDGTFQIASLIPGELVLATVHQNYAFTVQSISVPSSDRIQILLSPGGYITGTAWLDGATAPSGWASILRDDGHTDGRLRSQLGSGGSFELGPAASGEHVLQVRAGPPGMQTVVKKRTVFVETGKTTVVDFDFSSGTSIVLGEIHAENDEWGWCQIKLLPLDEDLGTLYHIGVEDERFFQIENVLPGHYRVEALATKPSTGDIDQRYFGEVFVPEEGEVRHDVVLILEDAE